MSSLGEPGAEGVEQVSRLELMKAYQVLGFSRRSFIFLVVDLCLFPKNYSAVSCPM